MINSEHKYYSNSYTCISQSYFRLCVSFFLNNETFSQNVWLSLINGKNKYYTLSNVRVIGGYNYATVFLAKHGKN